MPSFSSFFHIEKHVFDIAEVLANLAVPAQSSEQWLSGYQSWALTD
jgi:hypothetical protein